MSKTKTAMDELAGLLVYVTENAADFDDHFARDLEERLMTGLIRRAGAMSGRRVEASITRSLFTEGPPTLWALCNEEVSLIPPGRVSDLLLSREVAEVLAAGMGPELVGEIDRDPERACGRLWHHPSMDHGEEDGYEWDTWEDQLALAD